MFVMYHRHRDTASYFTRAQSSARVEESTDLRRKCGKARVSIVDRNWSFISSSASSLESRFSARICVHVSARVYMYICFFFPSAYINADQYRLHTCEKTREKESTREAGREGRQREVSKKCRSGEGCQRASGVRAHARHGCSRRTGLSCTLILASHDGQ